MKATHEQYCKAVEIYDNEGATAVFRYAESIGVDEHSYCPDCEEETPDCDDDGCLVCGTYKRRLYENPDHVAEETEMLKSWVETYKDCYNKASSAFVKTTAELLRVKLERDKLANLLTIAVEALQEWGDETTLPHIEDKLKEL